MISWGGQGAGKVGIRMGPNCLGMCDGTNSGPFRTREVIKLVSCEFFPLLEQHSLTQLSVMIAVGTDRGWGVRGSEWAQIVRGMCGSNWGPLPI
jgi:hypothetical protein